MRFDPTLCLILGPADTAGRDPVAVAQAAVQGGVTMVQLRWKNAPIGPFVALARRFVATLQPRRVPFIVNDDVRTALVVGADGVHVGQGDMPPDAVRALVGAGAIVGWSVDNPGVADRVPACVDYVGVGPIFATATKADHKAPMGPAGFARLRSVIGVPAMAIGGVAVDSAAALRAAGADGLAVVSAIAGAADPRAAAAALRRAFA
jgi:thiamine-phosphate pyrophosphorylase